MNHFLGRLERAQFVGVVADYDGTLCATDDRYDSLQEDMSRETQSAPCMRHDTRHCDR